MANVLIEESTMSAIGNAIREKTGKTDLILPADMPTEIEGIESGGSGGGQELLDAMIDRSITEVSSNATSIGDYVFNGCESLTTANIPLVTSIGNNAFNGCKNLTTADFPLVTSIGNNAFDGCESLTTANFPLVTSIGTSDFIYCKNLTTVNMPLVTSIGSYAFRVCENLTTADFPVATSIGSYAFNGCAKLKILILRKTEEVCTLSNKNAFSSTPIVSGTGYIYVPSALIEQYKVATNWSTYATQFRALEDYTIDGTVTGELDETKI